MSLKESFSDKTLRILTDPLMKAAGYEQISGTDKYIKASIDRFNSAKSTIRILDDKLSNNVFGNEEMIESLEAAYKRGVKIDIFSGPRRDERNTKLEVMNTFQRLRIHDLEFIPTAGFIVVDEEFSIVRYLDDPIGERNATLTSNSSLLADLNNQFENFLLRFE